MHTRSPTAEAATVDDGGTPVGAVFADRAKDPQHDVVRFLSRRECPAYRVKIPGLPPADDGADPMVIDTHSARLFIGERTVCKLKRAVAYSYLDMRDVDTRRRLCERELELNRRTLPDIYLDVVAITREPDGSLAIDGDGQPLDWVLRMRRFAQRDVLDDVAREHRLTPDLARRLGTAIARFHAASPKAVVDDGYARAREVVDELAAELDALGEVFAHERTERFTSQARTAVEAARTLLDRRAVDGFVRRCHGDLHLRNLLLLDGQPVPFDALEFDERMATTDVLYDLAFLIMDLGHRNLERQQNLVLNEYLRHSEPGNVPGLALLPIFLAMRAAVRAMTSAQAAHAATPSALPARRAEAVDYLDAALDSLLPRHPMLITVGGLSGSGKSTVAASLPTRVAPAPGAILLNSDAERKTALGVPSLQHLDPARYTRSASELNYQRLIDKAGHALRAGFTVVLDATWLGASERGLAHALAKACDVPFIGLWLDAPAATLRQRVRDRRRDTSDATIAVLDAQLALDTHTPDGWSRVDAGATPARTLSRALAILDIDPARSTAQ